MFPAAEHDATIKPLRISVCLSIATQKSCSFTMSSGESLATIGCCDKTMFLSYLMQTHPLFVSIVMFVKIRDFAASSGHGGFDGADKR